MNTKLLKTLATAAALGACVLASAQANASGPRDSGFASHVYGYDMHNGKRDPYTEGNNIGKRDPYSEGANIGKRDPYSEGANIGKRDPYTEGNRAGAPSLDLAGRDLTGVSAQPSHAGADAAQSAA